MKLAVIEDVYTIPQHIEREMTVEEFEEIWPPGSRDLIRQLFDQVVALETRVAERDVAVERLMAQRDALILVVRRLMGVLPDSEEHRTDACWDRCWGELDNDAKGEVQDARAEANKLLAEIEAPK